jgi:magnesium-transporting ATPase (P-type)
MSDLSPSLQPLHSMTLEQIFLLVQSNQNGLNESELPDRMRKFGPNIYPTKKHLTLSDHLFDQMNSPIIYILLASATVTIGLTHLLEGIIILSLVFLDLSLGLWIEDQGERTSVQSLSGMSGQESITVRRHNHLLLIKVSDLTVGDIFIVETGTIIPADGRILTSSGLLVMETLLTGVSHPVPKAPERCCDVTTPLSDRSCMVYSGTHVIKGTATCITIHIGVSCEIGKIHSLLEKIDDPKTPLMKELDRLHRTVVLIILVLGALTMVIATLRGYNLTNSFQFVIAITLAAIPEELPSCVTIVFAVCMRVMAKHGAIVKVIPAAEILGSVNVICSEKTGTLTKNEMILHQLCLEDNSYEVSGLPDSCSFTNPPTSTHAVVSPTSSSILSLDCIHSICCQISRVDGGLLRRVESEPAFLPPNLFLRYLSPALYCNDSCLFHEETSELQTPTPLLFPPSLPRAHPIDDSLVLFALSEFGSERIQTIRSNSPLEEIPFDSTKKFMATMHDLSLTDLFIATGIDGTTVSSELIRGSMIPLPLLISSKLFAVDGLVRVVFIKGAPEIVISFCRLTEISKCAWLSQATHLADHGLKVLGCASQLLPPDGSLVVQVAQSLLELTMSCVLGFDDPPREEAMAAIQSAHAAGIMIKLITGDHPLTALTIGIRLGIHNGHPHDPSPPRRHQMMTTTTGTDMRASRAQGVITGADLDALIVHNDLTTLDEIILNHTIFARTSPTHKLIIIQSLQRQHLSCCMTAGGGRGGGGNAPALKQADVGVVMTRMTEAGVGGGTEVAQDVSQIIITGDHQFATLVEAIRYGRCTYSNLLKILLFILPINAAQAWCLLIALICDLPLPFNSLQILWINMVPAVLLGVVLAFERPDPSLMLFPPRHRDKSIFGSFLIWRIVFVMSLLVLIVLGNVQWEKHSNSGLSTLLEMADKEEKRRRFQTVSVNSLIVGQGFYLFNCRYPRHNVWPPWHLITGNPFIWVGLSGVAVAQVLLTYSKYLQALFETIALTGMTWLHMIILGGILFLIIEIEKGLVMTWHRGR